MSELELILLYFFIAIGIFVFPKYVKYKNSLYRSASGNSFFKTAFNKGNYGEFLTYYSLEKMEGKHKLLTNLYIPKKDGNTTEIDLVMISESGIFVFESKNFSGWIFGNERSKKWTQTFPNKKKFQFFNPIWQNNTHINALKNLMKLDNDNLYKSYIIFSERCTLKKITVQSKNVKVIKRNRLVCNIKSDVEDSPKRLSQVQIESIYKVLREYTLTEDQIKRAHVAAIKIKV